MEIRHRRPFAKPWKIEEQGESFQIRDAAGRILANVYFEDEPGRQLALRKVHTLAQDKRIAFALFQRLTREVARIM